MNTSSHAELRIEIIEAFRNLQLKLEQANYHIKVTDAKLPIWFSPPDFVTTNLNMAPSRNQVCYFIDQLEYLPEQNPREIILGPGLAAASQKTFESLHALNEAKLKFKHTVLALKAQKLKVNDQEMTRSFESILPNRSNQVGEALAKMGLARLHLKQCYRQIPILEKRPNSVSWLWAHTRAIKKITTLEAKQRLEKQGQDPGILQQLHKLAQISANETLAIVQTLAPHLRANIVTPDAGEEVIRSMIKGPVPIFYLDTTGSPLPKIRPPCDKSEHESQRETRSDVKLEEEPFLPAIRAHRYKNNVSQTIVNT